MKKPLSLLAACLILAVAFSAQSEPVLDGDIVYMDATGECRAGTYKPNCYFQSEDAARKVVGQFARLNIKNYIFPVASYGDDVKPYLVFYSALKNTGGGFFLQEVGHWVNAGSSCPAYLKDRRAILHRLNRITGKAFLGFSDDEPELSTYKPLRVGMKRCLQGVPEFRDKLWLTNIFPVIAGASQLQSVRTGKPYTLADFGGCRMSNWANIKTRYIDYADAIFAGMQPDIGSFDLYPFNSLSRDCDGMAAALFKSNLEILKQQEKAYGFTPATYLQASESIYADVATPEQIAMTRRMAESYGIKTFLYFVSHSTDRKEELVLNGMLDENNEPTQIFFNHLQAYNHKLAGGDPSGMSGKP